MSYIVLHMLLHYVFCCGHLMPFTCNSWFSFDLNIDGYPFPRGWKETVEKSSAESEHILQAFFEKCKERNVRKNQLSLLLSTFMTLCLKFYRTTESPCCVYQFRSNAECLWSLTVQQRQSCDWLKNSTLTTLWWDPVGVTLSVELFLGASVIFAPTTQKCLSQLYLQLSQMWMKYHIHYPPSLIAKNYTRTIWATFNKLPRRKAPRNFKETSDENT